MSNRWHKGAAAVFTLTFDVDAETPILALGRAYAENLTTMSHQSYGPDVGVPRILDLLDDVAVPATFFIPGWVAESRPGLSASIVDRGHEVAHHSYSHRAPTSLSAPEEREDFDRAMTVFAKQGIPISGHRAAGWNASRRTPDLVAEYGLAYDSSLMHSDKPYRIATDAGEIIELPVHWSLDDWEQYAFLPEPDIGSIIQSPVIVAEAWRAELDGARHYQILMNLCLHPFLSGRPGRIMALRGLIERAQEYGDVAFERCRDLAESALRDEELELKKLFVPPVDPDVFPN